MMTFIEAGLPCLGENKVRLKGGFRSASSQTEVQAQCQWFMGSAFLNRGVGGHRGAVSSLGSVVLSRGLRGMSFYTGNRDLLYHLPSRLHHLRPLCLRYPPQAPSRHPLRLIWGEGGTPHAPSILAPAPPSSCVGVPTPYKLCVYLNLCGCTYPVQAGSRASAALAKIPGWDTGPLLYPRIP